MRRQPTFNRSLLFALVAASCVLLGLWLSQPAAADDDLIAERLLDTSASLSVSAVEPVWGALERGRVTTVTIGPARAGDIPATTSGRVTEILVPENEVAEANEPVLQLETDALESRAEQARLRLESAQVALAQAANANSADSGLAEARLRSAETRRSRIEAQLAETRELLAIGAAAPSEVATLELDLEQAQADALAAQESLNRAARAPAESLELLRLSLSQAETELASVNEALAASTVRAPYQGEVSELYAELGEFLASGSPAFRLLSQGEQVARLNVPPEVADELFRAGSFELEYAGETLQATPLRRSSLSLETQLVEVEAALETETDIPNGAVTQLAFSAQGTEGLLLPADAIQREGGSSFVYVAENSLATKVPVTLLAEGDTQSAVSGLSEEAAVIYPVPSALRENGRIELEP